MRVPCFVTAFAVCLAAGLVAAPAVVADDYHHVSSDGHFCTVNASHSADRNHIFHTAGLGCNLALNGAEVGTFVSGHGSDYDSCYQPAVPDCTMPSHRIRAAVDTGAAPQCGRLYTQYVTAMLRLPTSANARDPWIVYDFVNCTPSGALLEILRCSYERTFTAC